MKGNQIAGGQTDARLRMFVGAVVCTLREKDFRRFAMPHTWRWINGYVGTNVRGTTVYLARLLTGARPGERVVFRDGDRTNFLPTNLRITLPKV